MSSLAVSENGDAAVAAGGGSDGLDDEDEELDTAEDTLDYGRPQGQAADGSNSIQGAAMYLTSSPTAQQSSSLPMAATNSSASTDKALPLSPPDKLEHDLRRRSQFRSPGTATSPDLATIAQEARAKAAIAAAATAGSESSGTTSAQGTMMRGNSATTTIKTSPSSPSSPRFATRSRVSSDSGRRHSLTPVVPSVTSLQAAIDSSPRARAVSTLSDSGTSFVHVNHANGITARRPTVRTSESNTSSSTQVPPLRPTLDSDLGKVSSVSSAGSSSTRRTKKLTKNGEDNSISSAMRKTSRFFKKTFSAAEQAGPIASTSSQYAYPSSSGTQMASAASAPNTPASARFATFENPSSNPPVPTMPAAYAQPSTPKRRVSIDHGHTSPPSSLSRYQPRASPAKSFGRLSSFAQSFRSSDNRSATDLRHASSFTSDSAYSPPISYGPQSGMKTSTSTQSTEQERLARELHQWQGYEENLEMLATHQSNDSAADISSTTLRGSSSGPQRHPPPTGRTSIPRTPPKDNHSPMMSGSGTRSRSASGTVLLSGSIPSPNLHTNSPKPKSSADTFFLSGSIPSPQQAQRNFRAASSAAIRRDHSTATSPDHSAASSQSSPHAGFTTGHVRKPAANSPAVGYDDSSTLASSSGKQIRKRSSSVSASPATGSKSPQTASVRLVSSPDPQSNDTSNAQARDASTVSSEERAATGLGLGIGMQGAGVAPELEARNQEDQQSPPRPAELPRFVTHSPSPAQPRQNGLSSAFNSPMPSHDEGATTPSETSKLPAAKSAGNASLEGSGSTKSAKELAEQCWQEDDSFLRKEKIAEWLGSNKTLNQAALEHYMQHFDFAGLKLDIAFRRLCEKLYLRAETQQIDRILAEFSKRYLEENPDTLFQTRDIVHAITYAMLLLNTDLHVADVMNRMSRSDFVQNTMAAIHAQKEDSRSAGARTPGASYTPTMESNSSFFGVDRKASSEHLRDATTPGRHRPKRSGSASANSSRPGLNDIAAFGESSSNLPISSPSSVRPGTADGTSLHSGRTVSQPILGARAWDIELESVLKDIYNAVRSRAIMQPLAFSQLAPPLSGAGTPYSSLSSVNRTPSRRSQISLPTNERGIVNKRASIRGLLGTSHESLRATSPTPSVGTSMSGGYSGHTSFGSAISAATSYYPATIGFASNLSHTIIKEQQEDDDAQSVASDVSATDEELALLGAPRAKEGILQRKHYWDAPNKRSKDKNWLQVFAVISKGEMKMFQFGGSGVGGAQGGGMGGGNWLTNAQVVGDIVLAHSLSSAMPPPGYNRSRPHVFVLTLATGGSYFFQAGTEDLVNEWVLTCNYWAGRASKEPLMGGVSNMDYGWNRTNGLGVDRSEDVEDLASMKSGRSGHSKISRMSYTGTLSRHGASENSMDRLALHDWRAPQPPSGISSSSEDTQFEALRKHTRTLQEELERHNDLRPAMLRLYSTRSLNAAKAAANWEKKSKYLLAELIKYQTYVDALKVARNERQKRRDEKKVNRLLEEADDNAGLGDPNYVPEPLTPTGHRAVTPVDGSNRRTTVEDGDQEVVDSTTGHSPARRQVDNRASVAPSMASSATDFYEAAESRASSEL